MKKRHIVVIALHSTLLLGLIALKSGCETMKATETVVGFTHSFADLVAKVKPAVVNQHNDDGENPGQPIQTNHLGHYASSLLY